MPQSLQRSLHLLLIGLLAVSIAACAGGPPRRILAPLISVESLEHTADGWQLGLRLRNISTESLRYARLEFEFSLDGGQPLRIDQRLDINISTATAEFLPIALPLSTADAERVRSLTGGQSVSWEIDGHATAESPGRRFPVTASGRLSPTPGRPGQYR